LAHSEIAATPAQPYSAGGERQARRSSRTLPGKGPHGCDNGSVRIEIERRPNLIHAAGLDTGCAVGPQWDRRDPGAALLGRRRKTGAPTE